MRNGRRRNRSTTQPRSGAASAGAHDREQDAPARLTGPGQLLHPDRQHQQQRGLAEHGGEHAGEEQPEVGAAQNGDHGWVPLRSSRNSRRYGAGHPRRRSRIGPGTPGGRGVRVDRPGRRTGTAARAISCWTVGQLRRPSASRSLWVQERRVPPRLRLRCGWPLMAGSHRLDLAGDQHDLVTAPSPASSISSSTGRALAPAVARPARSATGAAVRSRRRPPSTNPYWARCRRCQEQLAALWPDPLARARSRSSVRPAASSSSSRSRTGWASAFSAFGSRQLPPRKLRLIHASEAYLSKRHFRKTPFHGEGLITVTDPAIMAHTGAS